MHRATHLGADGADPAKARRLFSEEEDGEWEIVHGSLADLLDGPEHCGDDAGEAATAVSAAGRRDGPFFEEETRREEKHRAGDKGQLSARPGADKRLSRPAQKVPIAREMAPLSQLQDGDEQRQGHKQQQHVRFASYDGPSQVAFRNVLLSEPRRINGSRHASMEVASSPMQPEFDMYTVQRGDTLQGVALRHNMTVAQLKQINHLFDSRIFQGQQLRVNHSPQEEQMFSPQGFPQLPARVNVELQDFSKEDEHEERDTDSLDLHRTHGQLTSEPIDIPRFLSDVTMLRSNDDLHQKAQDALSTSVEGTSPRSWKSSIPFLQRKRSQSFAGVGSPDTMALASSPAQGGFWRSRRPASGANDARPGLFFRRKAAQPQQQQQPTYRRPTSTTTVQSDLAYIQAEALASLKTKKQFEEIQYAGSERSTIFSQEMMQKLHDITPEDLHANEWRLVYSTERDGTSLQRFFQLVNDAAPTVVIVKTMDGEVFGGLAFSQWLPSFHYFGTGDALLFKADMRKKAIYPYRWTRKNTLLQYCTHKLMGMGGGDGNFGFLIDDAFHRGSTHACATFDNEPLTSTEDFLIEKLEVWTLLSPGNPPPESQSHFTRLNSV